MKPNSLVTSMLLSAALGAAGFLTGWAGHQEEYAAFWIIVGACGLRMLLPALVPGRLAAVMFAWDTLLVCSGFILGFWLGREDWWYLHRAVRWTALAWTLCAVAGAPIAWALNRWTLARRITGPYCRACRYCLRGVADHRCPECGRSFTLRELGVTAAELRGE